jgi:hypothetical protein
MPMIVWTPTLTTSSFSLDGFAQRTHALLGREVFGACCRPGAGLDREYVEPEANCHWQFGRLIV